MGWAPKTEDLAKVAKTGATVVSGAKLIKTIIGCVVFVVILIFLMFAGLPLYIGIPAVLFIILIVVLQVVRFKRISSADKTPKSQVSPQTQEANQASTQTIEGMSRISIGQNEKIINHISGIMRTSGVVRSTEIMGAGKIKHPENAMILTNRQVLLITVPVAGADKTIAGTDLGMMQWTLASKDIENKLKEIISTTPLKNIAYMNPKNFAITYSQIKKVKLNKFTHSIKFITSDGNYTYSIRNPVDFEKAKKLFVNFM